MKHLAFLLIAMLLFALVMPAMAITPPIQSVLGPDGEYTSPDMGSGRTPQYVRIYIDSFNANLTTDQDVFSNLIDFDMYRNHYTIVDEQSEVDVTEASQAYQSGYFFYSHSQVKHEWVTQTPWTGSGTCTFKTDWFN